MWQPPGIVLAYLEPPLLLVFQNAFLPTMPEDLLAQAKRWEGLEGVKWYSKCWHLSWRHAPLSCVAQSVATPGLGLDLRSHGSVYRRQTMVNLQAEVFHLVEAGIGNHTEALSEANGF